MNRNDIYTWGYLKNVILFKLDMEEDEANKMNYLDRFVVYANEAMTQICSSVMPKRTFFEVEINSTEYKVELKDGRFITTNIVEKEGNLNKPIKMPDDFISFGDDINTIDECVGQGRIIKREANNEDFSYRGYNQIVCHRKGKYSISYNARWIIFGNQDNGEFLEAPIDVLECIPSYVASQCMKVDDEYKSSVFRNEFELLLSRIDNSNFGLNKTFTIGGDW